MYKIFYTTIENIDTETNQPIDQALVLSVDTEAETLPEGQIIISKWDLNDWNNMQVYTKEVELKYINEWYEAEVEKLVKGVPLTERSTWTKQETEARGFIVDNTYSTPLLDTIAVTRNVDKTLLVSKVIEKSDLYTIAIGQLTGEKQRREDLLK